ncbi:MAG: putative ribosomal N-acetyltransferase YdaF [Candidatus Anoxychlamydiales bacterium]|nr:putative ribosomal N-acetyltransferase YdaF [Candidatus Anoxychlamydiales bacterium]
MIYLDIIDTKIKLETKRLILRKPLSEDIDDIFEYAKDEDVARFTKFKAHKTLQDAKMFLQIVKQQHQNKTALTFLLELKENKKVIGSISFLNISEDNERSEIGFALSKTYWGKGLMSEAIEKFLEFGFKKIKFNRLETFSNIENFRSIRLLNTFMQKEGILKEREKIKGRFCSLNIYSILRKEYILKKSFR